MRPQRRQQLRDAWKNAAFVQSGRLIADAEIRGSLLRLRLREAEVLHEHIHQRRPRKAAQGIQLRVHAAQVYRVADGLRYALYGVEHRAVKIEQNIFEHHISPFYYFRIIIL